MNENDKLGSYINHHITLTFVISSAPERKIEIVLGQKLAAGVFSVLFAIWQKAFQLIKLFSPFV